MEPSPDADWYAFCQALYKGIEGEDWEEMYDSCKVMSGAVGVRKPQEAHKAQALWAMKAAKDRKEKFYDPAGEEDISRRNKTRLELWEEHLKDPIAALDKASKCVESQCWRWLEVLWKQKAAMTSDGVVSDLMLPLWGEVLWPFLDAWDSVRLRTMECPREIRAELVRFGPSIRPHGELLSF